MTIPRNKRPIAKLTASPTAGTAPLTVAFDASGSRDPDGRVVSYRFDFGDGNSTPAAGPSASHTYQSPGSYVPSVMVTDNKGATARASLPPIVVAAPPKALLGASPPFVPSNGAPPPVSHAYGGPGGWNRPPADAHILNMRFAAKPTAGVVTASVFQPVLDGQRDALIDGWIADVRAINHVVLGTVHHEVLPAFEFLPSEPLTLWADAFVYVIQRFAAAGVTNVRWVSCLIGSTYVNYGGDALHTPTLLSLLHAVGADIYFSLADADPNTNPQWQAFAAYQPSMRHVVLEWWLRSSAGVAGAQASALDAVAAYLRAHPLWTALAVWNGNPEDAMDAEGAAKLEELAADPFWSRSVVE